MTTSEIKKLEPGCPEDRYGLMFPCYSFISPRDGEAYIQYETELRERLPRGNLIAEPIQYDRFYEDYYYVPRLGWLPTQRDAARRPCWLTTHLLSNDLHREKPKPIWKVLRSVTTPRTPGARNTMLLVGGRRYFRLPYEDKRDAPKWWHRLATGERFCFATWGGPDGSPLSAPMRGADDATFLHAARRGRGVLYAKSTMFDYRGQRAGFRTEVVLVQFNVLDSDGTKDDVLKIELSARISRGGGGISINHHDLDTSWRRLISQAQAGFEQYCLPETPAIEEWRRFFLEQKDKADAERRKDFRFTGSAVRFAAGPSFLRDISSLPWREALDLVDEAWKLQLVISEHCGKQFDATPNRYDSTGTRVRRMLTAYECSPERHALFGKMITDYVEPADNLWNYTGD